MEKQIMEQHLQETAGDLEYAERELSRRGSPIGTPPREDSDDGSPRQQTPTLRQQHANDPEHLKEENEETMEVMRCFCIMTWRFVRCVCVCVCVCVLVSALGALACICYLLLKLLLNTQLGATQLLACASSA